MGLDFAESIRGVMMVVILMTSAAAASRPNIVFLLADDLGYGDLACYGAKDIPTPNLDRLAAQGVRFTQFYANGSECSPTRAALLTGRYQQRVGGLECAIGNGNVGRYDDAIRLRTTDDLGLPASEPTLGQTLKAAGYATALFGKWHLGYGEKFSPRAHGFDETFYSIGGEMEYFHHVEPVASTGLVPALFRDGRPEQRAGYFTDLIADEAVRFLGEKRERPFFLYVPFTAPHAPYQGPDEEQPQALPLDSPRWRQGRAPVEVYAAMVNRMDAAIGRILSSLDRQDLAANTLVIFASDNGGTASARPSGLRGIKGSTFEGGIRVPCIVRWPGRLPMGLVSGQVMLTFDLTSSIVHAAGATPSPSRPLDGQDILAEIAGGGANVDRTVFWRGRRGNSTWKAVRRGDFKYVVHIVAGRTEVDSLFDLSNDPGEQHDLSASHRGEVDRLRALLANWEREVAPTR